MIDIKKTQREFVKALEQNGSAGRHSHYNDSYTGSRHHFYGVSVPIRRQLIKDWMREHKDASDTEVLALVEALIAGESHEEKTMGAILLQYHSGARQAVSFAGLNKMLDELAGWAEIDSFCYNVFSKDEMLAHWKEWKAFLTQLSKDTNIHKRRASLVYLTQPTTKSDDRCLHALGYVLTDRLKHEKEILITKAISWLLRSMAETHPNDVSAYLDKNIDTIPKIAIRETRKKILTGKKN